ncbi:peroxisomal d3,d2-enoyl-CoA isomerase [Kalaharituber pfeilii]|nr:peroxisomal d3,d2-enoyl-CoA isomerase [Kalaharituber pfeilii]
MSYSSNDNPLILDVQGQIAVIYINLSHKLNALTGSHYRQLAYLLWDIANMSEVVVTVLTGKGKYFSAGADVQVVSGQSPDKEDSQRTFWLQQFTINNIEVTRAFAEHPKLLVVALNGPAVGLSAAIVAHADFIYATSSTFLLAPFTSLGLVAEGASSYTFLQRLGLSKANEALILSKRLTSKELLECGFLNRIYSTPKDPNDASSFHKEVLEDIRKEFLERGLNTESMLLVKRLVRRNFERTLGDANVKEAFYGLERFLKGAPQKELTLVANGQKKHKL